MKEEIQNILIMFAIILADLLILLFISYAATRRFGVIKFEEIKGLVILQGNTLVGNCQPAYPKIEVLGDILGTEYRITELGFRTVTAYTSSEDETDSTPFITASNQETRSGIAASNELEFGQKFIIEGSDTIYEIQDRTNSRYEHLIDLWMTDKESAREFGRQTRKIYLIEE